MIHANVHTQAKLYLRIDPRILLEEARSVCMYERAVPFSRGENSEVNVSACAYRLSPSWSILAAPRPNIKHCMFLLASLAWLPEGNDRAELPYFIAVVCELDHSCIPVPSSTALLAHYCRRGRGTHQSIRLLFPAASLVDAHFVRPFGDFHEPRRNGSDC